MSDGKIASAEVIGRIVQTKATCPFIGTAVATGLLPVQNDAENPLASIDDVRALGNTGGGDLGEVLQVFATGNHLRMRGPSGALDTKTPTGLFSLEFPGSQGSHPGHSGILEGDPRTLASGRLNVVELERLTRRARNGFVTRSDVAHFIAENLHRDAQSKVLGSAAAMSLLSDLGSFVRTLGPMLMKRLAASGQESADAHRDVEEKLTRLLGEDNLVGAAGEFGLLFAFFANEPDAARIDGEPAISVRDLQAMFVDKRFPEGWTNWKKSRADWVSNTTALLVGAGAEYLRLRGGPSK
ncbi:MAG TPA: hypothetical protein VGA51_13570 [Casimicrobiaceae bacterium]